MLNHEEVHVITLTVSLILKQRFSSHTTYYVVLHNYNMAINHQIIPEVGGWFSESWSDRSWSFSPWTAKALLADGKFPLATISHKTSHS